MDSALQIILAIVAGVFSGGGIVAWMKSSYMGRIASLEILAKERLDNSEFLVRMSDGKQTRIIEVLAGYTEVLKAQTESLAMIVASNAEIIKVLATNQMQLNRVLNGVHEQVD